MDDEKNRNQNRFVQVSKLPLDGLVEIECMAILA